MGVVAVERKPCDQGEPGTTHRLRPDRRGPSLPPMVGEAWFLPGSEQGASPFLRMGLSLVAAGLNF